MRTFHNTQAKGYFSQTSDRLRTINDQSTELQTAEVSRGDPVRFSNLSLKLKKPVLNKQQPGGKFHSNQQVSRIGLAQHT